MSDEITKITCTKNGPALVSGKFTLVTPNGEEETIDGNRALCRCGLSKNEPFCDGSHKKADVKFDGK